MTDQTPAQNENHYKRRSIFGLAHPADRRNGPSATTRGTSKSIGHTPESMPTRTQQKSGLSGLLDGPITRRKAKQPKFASAIDRTRLSIIPDNKHRIIICVPVPDEAVDKFGWADFPVLQQRFSVPTESLRAPSSS
jgi:hypothetical protein